MRQRFQFQAWLYFEDYFFNFIIFAGSSVDRLSECYSLFSDVWSVFNQSEEVILNHYQKASDVLKTLKKRSKGDSAANNVRNDIFNLFFTSKLFTAIWIFKVLLHEMNIKNLFFPSIIFIVFKQCFQTNIIYIYRYSQTNYSFSYGKCFG